MLVRIMVPVCAAVLAAGSPLAGALQEDVVPPEIQAPGTQPTDGVNVESPTKCDNCHGGYDTAVEPAYNWRGSMMAQATRDPIFWATVAVAEQDFGGSGDLCLRCHTADGWLAGNSTPTDGSDVLEGQATGVACDLCHALANPDGSEHPGIQTDPFLAHDEGTPPTGWYGNGMYVITQGNEKLGPYTDAPSTHSSLPSEFHRSSEMCGTCHDVSNPATGDLAPWNGAQIPLAPGTFDGTLGGPLAQKAAFQNPPYAYGVVERTFSEHVSSGFPTKPVADYATLPLELQGGAIEAAWLAATAATPTGDYVDLAPRTFTCQTCHMRPVTGKGCNKAAAPVRSDLPLHDMTGGNYWAPDTIAWLDGQGGLVMGGGLSGTELSALAAGAQRARQNLTLAAGLTVTGDRARIVNRTGHKLLTGFPEGRRMWLNVVWRDDQGQVVREDGEYGPLAVTLDGDPLVVETLLDPEAPDTHVWEVHYGMTSEWAATLLQVGTPPSLALEFDRVDGQVELTLGELAAQPPGSAHETFHFVLNDTVLSDNRIPAWASRKDDLAARNALPVPATQFGAPGPGGIYRHWVDVPLNPPSAACTATVRLLYQPTSWEYVQFLVLANDESIAFLDSVGEDLLDAWLATAMAAPQEMASATWIRDCNANGVADCQDILGGTSSDVNADGVPDECQTLTDVRPIGGNVGTKTISL